MAIKKKKNRWKNGWIDRQDRWVYESHMVIIYVLEIPMCSLPQVKK